MNEVHYLFSGHPSFLSSRHPLLKLIIGLGLLTVFLSIPDRSAAVVALKCLAIAGLGLLTPGFARFKSWIRTLVCLGGFLTAFFLVTALGSLTSGGDNIIYFRKLALRSIWVVNVTFLIALSFQYRELIYLFKVLKIPFCISSQLLLVFLIWNKFFEEFGRVPLAWKGRGISSGEMNKRWRVIVALLKVVLLRTVRKANNLERALLSRGFDGRLYSFFSKPWLKNDSLILGAWLTVMLVLTAATVLFR